MASLSQYLLLESHGLGGWKVEPANVRRRIVGGRVWKRYCEVCDDNNNPAFLLNSLPGVYTPAAARLAVSPSNVPRLPAFSAVPFLSALSAYLCGL